jgi:HEAT repeats
MKGFRLLLITFVVAVIPVPVRAGLIFNRHSKTNSTPAQRVPALIAVARTEQDDRKRLAAVEELREYDPNAYPEIVPTLIEVSQRDQRSSVRLEALHSLAKMRPVTQIAGQAIQHASENDSSVRVRFQARTWLWQYHLSGYHGAGTPQAPPASKMDEPPLAEPQLGEPPLAPPADSGPTTRQSMKSPYATEPGASPSSPSLLPRGPVNPPLVPVNPPQLASPPTSTNDGPDLRPQE